VAWLRAHGARTRTLIAVFAGSTLIATVVGAALGVVIGTVAAVILYGSDLWAAAGPVPVLEVGAATIFGIAAIGALVAVLSVRGDVARELAVTQGELVRPTRPAWDRLHLDLVIIAAGILALIAVPQIRPVVGTEGNPTVSLTLSAFVAPCLLWIGLTLLVVRIGSWAARRRVLRVGLRRVVGVAGDLAGASLAARSATTGPIVLVVALTIGFAVSVLIFNATYVEQQRIDARLTLGADVKATANAPVGPEAAATLSGPGIAAATPFVDRIVYVGPEAQDLLAIDPVGLPRVAPLSDSFFSGTTADAAMAGLRSQPDGILVSAETARDYSMVPGDRVRIRVPDASGALHQVDFRMLGIALEFPTAPKDAFLVANLDWVRHQTGNDRISFVLASANGDPLDASRHLAQRLGPGWQVSDLTTTTARLANEVTSVDLGRLVLIDLAFALVIVTIGFGLFLTAALSDRSRELATLAAIGAEPRQLLAAISAETAAIVATAVVAGVTAGALIGTALVGVLNGVFDPAPPYPLFPGGAIVALIALTVVAVAVTLYLFGRRFASLDLVGPLRVR
jgi:putative ABC transport system permease protein